MMGIPLTQGKVAIVDDEDYEALAVHKWCAAGLHGKFRASRLVRVRPYQQVNVYMHREILGAAPGQKVRFIDGDGLNLRRRNLELQSNREQRSWQALRNRMTALASLSQHQGVISATSFATTCGISLHASKAFLRDLEKDELVQRVGAFEFQLMPAGEAR